MSEDVELLIAGGGLNGMVLGIACADAGLRVAVVDRQDPKTMLGEKFDGDRVKAYPPGSVIVLPGETWHFHWAKSGEYVTQVTAIGPLGLEYHDAHDDPRRHSP